MYQKTKPYSYPLSFNHILQFDSDIEDAELYAEFADTLIAAGENDVVSIYFNTSGGSASTMVQLINLMRNCKAHIDGYLVGTASSAGSFLLLNCDNIYVGEYTEMLVHTVSFGSGGDYPSVKAHVDHVGKQAEKLIKDTYKYFLTEEEMQDVLVNNRQLYLDSDEINRRLDVREKLMLKDQPSAQKQAIKEMEDMFSEEETLPDWVLDSKKLTRQNLVDLFKGKLDIEINEEAKTFILIPVDLPEVA